MEATRVARSAKETELASARIEHEWRARTVRSQEHDLAGLAARLTSLEELQAGRAEYGDAPRTLLAQANGKVGQRGAIADYLEVDPGYERAVEACLGDLLQHVIVERPEHAAAGFQLVREQQAGRCGFLIAGEPAASESGWPSVPDGDVDDLAGADGLVPLSSVLRVNGPFAAVIGQALGDARIAGSYEQASAASVRVSLPIATMGGDVFRGPRLVSGGNPQETRGILETKREIKDLAARIAEERERVFQLAEEAAGLEAVIAAASNTIALLHADHHGHEKAIVALDAQLQRASEDATRIAQKGEQLARERRQAEEERDGLERRQEEAHASIVRLEHEQHGAEEVLTAAQRRLFESREAAQDLSRRAAEAGAAHAALVERAAGLVADVERLEQAGVELEARFHVLTDELEQTHRRVDDLRATVLAGQSRLDQDIRSLEALRAEVAQADDHVSSLRIRADEYEAAIRLARGALESLRAAVSELDIARATAESDLAHLASTCMAAVQASLDQVLVEVADLEREGTLTPDVQALEAEEPDELNEAGEPIEPFDFAPAAALVAAEQRTLSAEDAIARLREKIDRLGPVNMIAIEQYDELETRHTFLTTQRKDLIDSISQTTEAITRIDETTRERFSEAFTAINRNFQEIFTTLFGGGRAGLTLLDENDPLESGIEIVAQPPGKRLQSVQLLSGGEKALTAISLMFGLFKYKPSPFCLLDEIDAPLDDANIGRFVAMLRSMQEHTQFILITHNRKTMEIADRLYGVTMEEPGVSKLISVQLH
jgi:chromosome segregation protein